MQENAWIAICVAAASLGIVVIAFIVHKRRSSRARYNPEHRKRRSDVVKLENIDRVNFLQAERLKKEGNPHAAARLLEKIGMVREAIDTLEESQAYQAAADILLRMGLPNRAGALLERNKKWHEAIQCYRLAKTNEDILRCVRAFCHADGITDPVLIEAECQQAVQEFLSAARIFASCSLPDKACQNYLLAAERQEIGPNVLNAEDLQFIVSRMAAKKLDDHLLSLLKRASMLQALLVRLLNAKNTRNAAFILKTELRTAPERRAVLSDDGLNEDGRLCFAETLADLSDYVLAAHIFEKIGRHEDAGRLAEVAQDYLTAARNYALAGIIKKASEMRVLTSVGESSGPSSGNQIRDITSEVEHGETMIQIIQKK